MNTQLLWLDFSQKHLWKEYLLKLPENKRDVYYEPDYTSLYAGDNGNACCFIYEENSNIYIYPFILRPVPEITGYFDIVTPYGYGGPVTNCEDYDFLNEAYQSFYKEAIKRKIIAEVIKFHPLLNNHLFLKDIYNGNIQKVCSTIYVEMDVDEDYRWRKIYTHANRKNINKAKRNNAVVKFGQDDEIWQAFNNLYNATLRVNKVKEFYYFSLEYFENIRKYLVNNYVLVSCIIDGKIVAVMLVFLGGIYAYCHLIGTEREVMSVGVNNLLHHELILWCKQKRYTKLLIGGGRTNSDNDLLLKFKKNFSDKTSAFYVGEYVLNSEIYNKLCKEWSLKNPGRQVSNCLLKYRL